jgi:alpha(1,3/1,4) fucosyltransferase
MRKIRVSYLCQFPEYEKDFLFRLLLSLYGDRVKLVHPRSCDLLIAGPFRHKMLGLRMKFKMAYKVIMAGRKIAPRVLYQTGENTRWNAIESQYSISSDLGVTSPNHFRFPLWMAMFDWKHEGVVSHGEERFGPPIPIEQLMQPLGTQAGRIAKAILISSHQKEPRATLLESVRKVMEVECYGSAFPSEDGRKFLKVDVCKDKQFALCPENSMSPGYYTEKIPDAFAAGCVPITWCDENVGHDFNPAAIINMARFAGIGYAEGLREAVRPQSLARIREQPLLTQRPSLDGIKSFLSKILADLTS